MKISPMRRLHFRHGVAHASALLLGLTGLALVTEAPAYAAGQGQTCTGGTSGTCTVVFSSAGTQTWTVTAGTTSASFTVDGAQGGQYPYNAGPVGLGAEATLTEATTPGTVFTAQVGGAGGGSGAGGANGGGSSTGGDSAGGGGYSALLAGSTYLIVAGGGGGNSGGQTAGGSGGLVGQPGGNDSVSAATGGGGGTATAGGTAGIGDSDCGNGSAGTALQGASASTGAGGGGGWYGGGSGGAALDLESVCAAAGGGGGSSYADPSLTGVAFTTGTWSGNGRVQVVYANPVHAADGNVSTNANTALVAGSASGVLSLASGPTALTATVESGPSHGTLVLNADGSYVYTPAAGYGGTDSFTYRATDTDGDYAVGTVNINVVGIALTPMALPTGTAWTTYGPVSFDASGGTAPYAFAISSGSLPSGLTLSAAGTLSGTPTVNGTFPITVTATDATGHSGSLDYNVVVNPPVISLTPPPGGLPQAGVGVRYSQTFAAMGGTAPYTYAATGVPAGMSFDPSTGVLAGTPTTSGTAGLTVTATDAHNYSSGPQSYSLTINFTISITPTTVPPTDTGVAYSQQLTAAGDPNATGGYTYAVTSGSLPGGLTLSPAGLISGTPTAAGASSFTVTASGQILFEFCLLGPCTPILYSDGYSGTQAYTLVVHDPVTVSFNAEGGSPTPVSQTIPWETSAVPPSAPSLTNYTFNGWSTTSDGSAGLFDFSTPITSDTTFYAQWSITNPVTVTFNSEGGTPTPDSQVIPAGTEPTQPSDPTRAGYTFDGWYTAATGGGLFDFTQPPGDVNETTTSDLTLYAQWSITNPVTITFNTEGGSPAPTAQTIPSGTDATAPSAPTLTNYTFNGWSTTSDGSSGTFNFSTPITADATLYAQWSITNPVTITFNAEGGSPTPTTQTIPSGTGATAPTNPSLTNYTFDGWYTAPNGGTQFDFLIDTVATDTTLYAQWSITNPVTVTFNAEGGAPVPTAQTIPSGTDATAPNAPTLANYTFDGWSTTADGSSGIFDFSTAITSNTALYAQWTGIPLTLAFNTEGSTPPLISISVAYGTNLCGPNTVSTPSDPSRTGYTFDGWYTKPIGGTSPSCANGPIIITADTTLYAQWTRVTVDPSTVAQGVKITITGTGYFPGEHVNAVLHSKTLNLGTYTANRSGTVAFTTTVPTTFPVGSHAVILTGQTSHRTAQAALKVTTAQATPIYPTQAATGITAPTNKPDRSNGWLPELLTVCVVGGLLWRGRVHRALTHRRPN